MFDLGSNATHLLRGRWFPSREEFHALPIPDAAALGDENVRDAGTARTVAGDAGGRELDPVSYPPEASVNPADTAVNAAVRLDAKRLDAGHAAPALPVVEPVEDELVGMGNARAAPAASLRHRRPRQDGAILAARRQSL